MKFFSDFVEFTDEEGYGKYLDLHECYEKYINLKGIEVNRELHFSISMKNYLFFFFSESGLYYLSRDV